MVERLSVTDNDPIFAMIILFQYVLDVLVNFTSGRHILWLRNEISFSLISIPKSPGGVCHGPLTSGFVVPHVHEHLSDEPFLKSCTAVFLGVHHHTSPRFLLEVLEATIWVLDFRILTLKCEE